MILDENNNLESVGFCENEVFNKHKSDAERKNKKIVITSKDKFNENIKIIDAQ